MSDSKQKQDFSARLQRIQEKHGHHEPQPPKPTQSRVGTGGSSRVNAVIWGVLACLAGVGSYFGLMMFDDLRQSGQQVSTQETLPTSQAGQTEPTRQVTKQGWSILSPGLATADFSEMSVSDIAAGFDLNLSAVPKTLIPFQVNRQCTLRKPQPIETVYNVRMGTGTLPTTTHVFSNETIADALLKHVEGVTSSKKNYLIGSRGAGRMFVTDVFVTDTSAPVYLVLQSFRQNVIWNLQLADGVRVSHVAMIGENSGLVVPERHTTFEALRISDFVTNFEFGANDDPPPCMVAPWRRPQAHWPAQEYANNGNDLYKNQIYSFNSGYRAFDDWYRRTLGVPADINVTAPHSAAHVLVGDVPDQPVQYRSMDGREVYITQNDFALIGDDEFESAHIALLTAAIGGDPALLDPAPQEVVRK